MVRKKIGVVFGTRPEAIKMAPVIHELKQFPAEFEVVVIVSAQHREMLDQVLDVFDIEPDYDLDIMKPNQSLSHITADVLKGLEEIFIKEACDMILVHGDTTTSFSAALAAYYQKIPVAHVEAGLRTYDKSFPFPEEVNRQMIDNIADLYFAPTKQAQANLLQENKPGDAITVTGNTAIDALTYTKEMQQSHPVLELVPEDKPVILLTMHRRENFGEPMKQVFTVINRLTAEFAELNVIMPVHLNPNVQQLVAEHLADNEHVHLCEPLSVEVFHQLMAKATVILTDSGGLQEEAPALDLPVLVLRDTTERPEGIEAGTLKLVGTHPETVYAETKQLLTDRASYERMAQAKNPYGDGHASERIVAVLQEFFQDKNRQEGYDE